MYHTSDCPLPHFTSFQLHPDRHNYPNKFRTVLQLIFMQPCGVWYSNHKLIENNKQLQNNMNEYIHHKWVIENVLTLTYYSGFTFCKISHSPCYLSYDFVVSSSEHSEKCFYSAILFQHNMQLFCKKKRKGVHGIGHSLSINVLHTRALLFPFQRNASSIGACHCCSRSHKWCTLTSHKRTIAQLKLHYSKTK